MPKCECGLEMDTDCNGNQRCEDCDGPCLCCFDGGMDASYDDELIQQQIRGGS
jgi:hypothetical protein